MKNIKDHALGPRFPLIMGIVNVTPDSFSDGGMHDEHNKAIAHGLKLLAEGADILDIGGESTRPGAIPVSEMEEIGRVVPVIEALAAHGARVSIDSRNSRTMEAALEAGATIINDISGLTNDPRSIGVAAQARVPVILMHAQGDPVDMQKNPYYNNVIEEIVEWLKSRIKECETHRIDTGMLAIDPGIGFGKRLEDNVLILSHIKKFHDLDVPILLGASRKRFIAEIGQGEEPMNRLGGSLASALWGLAQGVQMFRVHDVKETRQAFDIYQALSSSLSVEDV